MSIPTSEVVARLVRERGEAEAEAAALHELVEAFKAVPLYSTERNWSSDDESDTIELCNGCGFPGVGDHDGQDDCPVAIVERLLSDGSREDGGRS